MDLVWVHALIIHIQIKVLNLASTVTLLATNVMDQLIQIAQPVIYQRKYLILKVNANVNIIED